MTLTTLHLGQVPGRVRCASVCGRPAHSLAAWRSAAAAPAIGGFRATTVSLVGTRYSGNAIPVGDAVFMTTFVNTGAPATKRPTRHLDSRTT